MQLRQNLIHLLWWYSLMKRLNTPSSWTNTCLDPKLVQSCWHNSSQSKNHGSCANQPVIAFEPMIRFGVCPHYISLSFSWPLSTEKVRACTTVYIHILTSKVLKVISQIWLDLIGISFPLATVIDYFVKRSTDCLSHGVDLLLMSI